MDREEILIGLYKGRKINKEQFNKYFRPNGCSTEEYIYYIEQNGVIQYQLHAYINDDAVDHVGTFKANVRGNGHYRPVVEERALTASEKKYAYEIFDLCFINPALEDLSSVICNAVEQHSEYEGYRILKELKDGVQFISPDGTKSKLSAKVILYALEYSHQDVSIIRDPSMAEDFIEAFAKTPYQPLFAILQTVDATLYPNYKELNDNYRFDEFDNIVCAGKIDSYPEYSNLLYIFPERIRSLCTISIGRNNYASLKWILDNTAEIDYELNSCIYDAVRNDNYELFNILIDSGKYKADPSMRSEWTSAINWAFEHKAGEKYFLPLLKRGKYIPDSLSSKILDRIPLEEISEYIEYGLRLDQSAINKIISNNRWDLLSVIENNTNIMATTEYLLIGYIKGKLFDRFISGLSSGYDMESTDLFDSAFRNGQAWTDELLKHGYDVNVNEGELLFEAARGQNIEYVNYLLSNGAKTNLKHNGYTALEVASQLSFGKFTPREYQVKICRLLIDFGADPTSSLFSLKNYPAELKKIICDWLASHGKLNIPTDAGMFAGHLPLYYVIAPRFGKYDEDLVLYYINNGAVPNANGISEDALFVEACSTSSLEVLEKMLISGANINEVDSEEETGLMRAATNHDIEKVKFLVEHGAEINYVKINTSESALDIAEEYSSQSVIDYLASHGAKHGAELLQTAN